MYQRGILSFYDLGSLHSGRRIKKKKNKQSLFLRVTFLARRLKWVCSPTSFLTGAEGCASAVMKDSVEQKYASPFWF